MKLYKTTISPISNFGTTLKGDTLFGQMCWAVKFVLGEDKLITLLNNYSSKPYLVVSDGFAKGYLPKPKMPSFLLNEDANDKKSNRKKVWLTLEALEESNFSNAKTDEQAKNKEKSIVNMHNSINYKTFTTSDDGAFAPYGEHEFGLSCKDIYFLIDEDTFTLDNLKEAFSFLSQSGYGKDTSIGKGRFTYTEFREVAFSNCSKNYMTLSPFSPKDIEVKELYYEPFTRFGKLAANRAFKNVFKKPIVLADCASVLCYEEEQTLAYVGSAVTNISEVYPDTVHQGYSIVIPMKEFS